MEYCRPTPPLLRCVYGRLTKKQSYGMGYGNEAIAETVVHTVVTHGDLTQTGGATCGP